MVIVDAAAAAARAVAREDAVHNYQRKPIVENATAGAAGILAIRDRQIIQG